MGFFEALTLILSFKNKCDLAKKKKVGGWEEDGRRQGTVFYAYTISFKPFRNKIRFEKGHANV